MNVWQEITDLKEGFEKNLQDMKELRERTARVLSDLEELKKWAATLTNVTDSKGVIKP